MNSQEQLILSNYIVKSAFGAPLMKGLALQAAKKLAPSGLSLARQGMGQVARGLGQAATTGLSAVGRAGLRAGQSARAGIATAGRGVISAAKNPAVTGLAGGLAGGLGAGYMMSPNTAQAAAAIPTAPPAAPTAPAATPAAAPALATAPSLAKPAPSVFSQNTGTIAGTSPNLNIGGGNNMPLNIPQQAQSQAPDLSNTFNKYMGGNYDPNSRVDQAKMQYLQGLSNKGVALNAANIYGGQGYGNW